MRVLYTGMQERERREATTREAKSGFPMREQARDFPVT